MRPLRLKPLFCLMLLCWVGLVSGPGGLSWAEGEDDPLWNRPSYEKKAINVGQRILAANGIRERIVFLTVKPDIRNAYASRYGGPNTIVIYKDLLDVITSDDELAAVLSHEIAHITKRHTGKTVPKKYVAKTALLGIYTAGAAAAAVATGGLTTPLFLVGAAGMKRVHQTGIAITGPISRPYEKEADLVGLDYMVKAGYNPLAMETLQMKVSGDSGPVAAFFSSHPVGTERLAYIHEAIQAKYPQFLTADLANNPLPGSPYRLQTETADSKAEIPTPPEKLSYQTPIKKQVAPEKPAAKIKPAAGELKTEKQPLPKTESKVVPDGSVAIKESAPSVAQVLLSLKPDELKILDLIRRKQYLSQTDLAEQLAYQEPEILTGFLYNLKQQKLVRVLGAQPDAVYILTDWAAQALSP